MQYMALGKDANKFEGINDKFELNTWKDLYTNATTINFTDSQFALNNFYMWYGPELDNLTADISLYYSKENGTSYNNWNFNNYSEL